MRVYSYFRRGYSWYTVNINKDGYDLRGQEAGHAWNYGYGEWYGWWTL